MSRFSLSQNSSGSRFSSSGSSGSRFGGGRSGASELDLESLAQKMGIAEEKSKKLSFLGRLGAGLSSFETGNAVYTAMEKHSIGAGLGSYFGGVAKGIGSAVTGNDYGQTEKKTYKDIVEKMGVTNGVAKFGLGLVGDIFLDPSTYFGGALVKGGIKATKGATKIGLKTIGKVAPDVEKGIRLAGQGVKDAAGKAFVFGYGTSKGLSEKTLTAVNKLENAKVGVVASNIKRLGTGTLTEDQAYEVATKLLAGKRAEYELGQSVKTSTIDELNKLFPDLKLKDAGEARKVLDNLETVTADKIADIRKGIDDIVKPFFASRQKMIKGGKTVSSSIDGLAAGKQVKSLSGIDELNRVVDGLKAKLSELRKGKIGKAKTLGDDSVVKAVTDDELIDVSNKLVAYEEQRLAETIEALSKKIENFKPGVGGKVGEKIPMATAEETIIYGERLIAKLQADLTTKSQMLGKVIDGSSIGKKLVREAIETGDYSKIPGQFQDALKLKSTDPLVQKTIAEQITRSQKFAKGANIDDPFTVYFPGIKKEKIQQFFESTKKFKIGSEEYTKEFKNLLGNDELVLNPAEAFAKTESQIIKNNIVRDELGSMIKGFGKPLNAFKNADEATAAGYRIVKEKGVFGKELGYLKDVDKKFIDDLISPEFATIDAIAKHTGFDAVTSLFKRSVTGLFPAFHVRNYVSGLMQNYEVLGVKALSPVNLAHGHKIALAMAKKGTLGSATMDIAGKAHSLNKVMEPFAKRFGTSSQYIQDIADATAYVNKPLTKVSSKVNLFAADSIVFRNARAIGNFVETQQKATAYVTALRSGSSVKDALKLAEKAGFDYRALTGFESKVLRRIIPFYSFTRKNVELQLRTLGENPQRIANIMKLMRDAGNVSGEELGGLPEYAKEQFTAKIGNDFIVGFGTPIEQLGQIFGKNPIRRWASMMNPIVKLPLERAMGKDFFRDRPLKEAVEAGEYVNAPGFVKSFLQVKEIERTNKDGTKKTVYNANPFRLQLLRNLPTTRGATYVSAIFDERGVPAKILSSFTGVKPRPIDLETVKYFRDRDAKRELEDLLIQYGVLKRFETVYKAKNQIPKNNEK